jgi:hypothetical protein
MSGQTIDSGALFDADALKRDVSHILLGAINGEVEAYRTPQGYIRWGRVEQEIHDAIDQASNIGIRDMDVQNTHNTITANDQVERTKKASKGENE